MKKLMMLLSSVALSMVFVACSSDEPQPIPDETSGTKTEEEQTNSQDENNQEVVGDLVEIGYLVDISDETLDSNPHELWAEITLQPGNEVCGVSLDDVSLSPVEVYQSYLNWDGKHGDSAFGSMFEKDGTRIEFPEWFFGEIVRKNGKPYLHAIFDKNVSKEKRGVKFCIQGSKWIPEDRRNTWYFCSRDLILMQEGAAR